MDLFAGPYAVGWSNSRVNGMLKYVPEGFFDDKDILELGCGYAAVSDVLSKHCNAKFTCSDGRPEYVAEVKRRFPQFDTRVDDCDVPLIDMPHYDVIIHFGLLYHLKNFREHLKEVLGKCDYLFLETIVCNSLEDKVTTQTESGYDQAMHGIGSRPSPKYVENILAESGFKFQMLSDPIFSFGTHRYEWTVGGPDFPGISLRKFWIACAPGFDLPIKTEFATEPVAD